MKICCRQQFCFYPIFLLYLYNLLRSHYFQVPVPLQGVTSGGSSSRGSSSGDFFPGEFCTESLDGSIFVACFVGKASSGASISFPCAFLFRGILSFAPIGLSRFRRALDSFVVVLVNCPTETSIFAGVLAAGM